MTVVDESGHEVTGYTVIFNRDQFAVMAPDMEDDEGYGFAATQSDPDRLVVRKGYTWKPSQAHRLPPFVTHLVWYETDA